MATAEFSKFADILSGARVLWKINKTDNESGDTITDLKENLRTVSEYYEQLYGNKLDNLEEVNKFLETHKIPKQIQEEIENLGQEI